MRFFGNSITDVQVILKGLNALIQLAGCQRVSLSMTIKLVEP